MASLTFSSQRRADRVMPTCRPIVVSLALLLCCSAHVDGEILVRWDQDRIPPQLSLGIAAVVVPAKSDAAVRSAVAGGYRVYLEVETPALARFVAPAHPFAGIVVTGAASSRAVDRLRARFSSRGIRVLTLEQGKWPHIRSNWVTRNNEVLQVTGRSAQPWIENNRALLRIIEARRRPAAVALTYSWQPITLSDLDEGPDLENYLVAIAEAGSLGVVDLLLPLHPRFQTRLLGGHPQARAEWEEISRYLKFYSWTLPGGYEPVANIGVVTSEPMLWFEVMNLLGRHNLPFALMNPKDLPKDPGSFRLLIALGEIPPTQLDALAAFARKGGTLVLGGLDGASTSRAPWREGDPVTKTDDLVSYATGEGRVVELLKPIADPDALALHVRQLLGREHRVVEIWNGITVLAAPYEQPSGGSVLLTMVNYAHQRLPIQIRVPGTFSLVHYETPEEAAVLVPHQHRDGYTEFVLPALRAGGRVFLSRVP